MRIDQNTLTLVIPADPSPPVAFGALSLTFSRKLNHGTGPAAATAGAQPGRLVRLSRGWAARWAGAAATRPGCRAGWRGGCMAGPRRRPCAGLGSGRGGSYGACSSSPSAACACSSASARSWRVAGSPPWQWHALSLLLVQLLASSVSLQEASQFYDSYIKCQNAINRYPMGSAFYFDPFSLDTRIYLCNVRHICFSMIIVMLSCFEYFFNTIKLIWNNCKLWQIFDQI